MKRYTSIARRAAMATTLALAALGAAALPSGHFATSSRLSSGKWVKIAIPADGVYELTAQELSAMGFSNVNNVQVWGNGGHMMSEILNGKAIDDLQQVASAVVGGKLCFYGKGPVGINQPIDADMPVYTRTINAYSTMGYYFLTEGTGAQRVTTVAAGQQPSGAKTRTTSLDYFYHEVDRYSYSHSGKEMLGEDITRGGSLDFALPQAASSELYMRVVAGGKCTGANAELGVTITPQGGSATVTTLSGNTINKPTKTFNYYNTCTAMGYDSLQTIPTAGTLQFTVTPKSGGSLVQANLDNILITYTRNNVIDAAEQGQMRMTYMTISDDDVIVLPGAAQGTVVWNLDNENEPVAYELGETDNGYGFVPGEIDEPSSWVAFDPSKTLMKIAGYDPVAAQNLHGMAVPDMLIITNKTFMEQAQRIVDMHKQVDNLEIAIVDQDEIFNEFSSGTPDAMAYRLLCKMLYDRTPSKFKYLLLLGEGSYDNRGLISNKKNRILTYQTDVSNNEDYTYPADDFFGFMDDNSGAKVASAMLRLGVGRIPSSSIEEAKTDIDKLIKYVLNPDYGPWRNNAMYVGETGDNDMHMYQVENIANMMANTLKTGFEVNKVYIDMYPRAVNETALTEDKRTSSEARRAFIGLLERGQFYGTYVGHAGYRSLTKSRLWTTTDVNTTTYPHLPILMTACCDVSRYDGDSRGIAEHMFHNPDGGAIALLTSTREVYANSNDQLNQAWTKFLFSKTPDGKQPTLGYAYMKAKQSFGSSVSAPNKLKYVLLGDPAMQVSYPQPLFQITEVNSTPITADSIMVTVSPLERVTVKAQVLDETGTAVDTEFNGDATLTIYDKEVVLKETSYNGKTSNIYNPRDILAQVQGRVENGVFTAEAVIPRYCRAQREMGMARVYAHKDGTSTMVNGEWRGLRIAQYDAATAVTDDEAPVVERMFLGDDSDNEQTVVGPSTTLYITATDNLALNNQSLSLGNNMRLLLDGNTSYSLIDKFATVTRDGRQLDIAFPLTGLTEGQHSLSYTVHDAAGNATTRSISFAVAGTGNVKLGVEELPATTSATITASSALSAMPTVFLKVTDALGNLVWTTKTDAFPVNWDLKDRNGNAVAGGVYKVYGNYNDGTNYGGTNVATILIVEPLK